MAQISNNFVEHQPVTIDSNGSLISAPWESEKRYLGLEIELAFDNDVFVDEDSEDYEPSPDRQETVEVYLSEYDEYIEIDNPYYDPYACEGGIVNELIENYYSDVDFVRFKYDCSIYNGVELALEPVAIDEWQDVINSNHFNIVQELYDNMSAWRTEESCGVHLSVSKPQDEAKARKEIKKIEYILFRLQDKLMDLTRDSSYADWFTEYTEEEFIIRSHSRYYSMNGGDHRCVRDNENRHEFRFFNVPVVYLRHDIIRYGKFIEQVMQLCDIHSFASLVIAELDVTSNFDITCTPNARAFSWSSLSSDMILDLAI